MFKVVRRVEIESTEPGGEPFYITAPEATLVLAGLRVLQEGGESQMRISRNSTDGVLTVSMLGDACNLHRTIAEKVSRRGLSCKEMGELLQLLEKNL